MPGDASANQCTNAEACGWRVTAEALEYRAPSWVSDRAMEARVKPTSRGVVLSGDEVGAAACGIAALLTTRLRLREGVAGGAVVNGLHVMKVIHEATAVDVTAESCIRYESIATLTSPHVADAAGKEVGE